LKKNENSKELKFTKDESEMREKCHKLLADEKIYALLPRVIIIVLTFHLFCHIRSQIEREVEEEEKIFQIKKFVNGKIVAAVIEKLSRNWRKSEGENIRELMLDGQMSEIFNKKIQK
jgi:hypothetical protein